MLSTEFGLAPGVQVWKPRGLRARGLGRWRVGAGRPGDPGRRGGGPPGRHGDADAAPPEPGNNCALPRTASGASAGFCADGYSGACSYACSDRVWTRTSNTCAPLDCPQATLGNCLLPETDHGSSAAGSCAAGYSGACRFSCNLGDWTEDANTCKTAEQECVERGREWIPPSPERARTCSSSRSCFGHDHSCTAEPGTTCGYKEHDTIICTNHKDRTCRPYPATAGVCIPRRR